MAKDIPENYDDDTVCLCVEGLFQQYSVTAYSSPDADGRTFIDGDVELDAEKLADDRYGAPFPVDVVIRDPIYPQAGEIEAIRRELGDELAAKFDGKVDEVYEKIDQFDDPLQAILDLVPEDL